MTYQLRILAAVTAALVLPLTASARMTTHEAQWQQALHVRSVALNDEYQLGARTTEGSQSAKQVPGWLHALRVRGEAMNQRLGLGR
jgi:hypothetical protein